MISLPRPILLASVLLAALAGCSNVPPAEDTTAASATPTAAASAAQTQPVGTDDARAKALADEAAARAAAEAAARAAASAKPLESIGAPNQRSVYFDFDRYEVRDEFKGMVAEHGKFLVGRKDARMLIQGNADERGSREYNLALGQRRSDAVKKVLLLQGVKEEQIESVSLGEEKPKATGHDEAAWAENRRADMLYKGEY